MAEKLITIASFSNAIEAHILRTRLEAEDIPCLIANEHVLGAMPHMVNLFGGVQVKVRASDEARALEIMQEEN